MEGQPHPVRQGNSLRSCAPDTVHLDVRNIALRAVNIADFFRNSRNVVIRNPDAALFDMQFTDMAVFTGQREIGKPGAVRQRRGYLCSFLSVVNPHQQVIPDPDCLKAADVLSGFLRGSRRLFLHFCFDFPRPVVYGVSVDPDLAVFKIIHFLFHLFPVVNAFIQGIKQDYRRNRLPVPGNLLPVCQADLDDLLPDKDSFRNFAPVFSAVQLAVFDQLFCGFPFLHVVSGVLVNQLLHDPGYGRVKLRSRSCDDFLPDHVLRNWPPVAPVGGQRVICIRDGNNPGNLRNCFPFQSVRIPCSVVPFMMVMGPDADIRIIRDTGKDLVAQHRVFLDFLVFFRCQVFLFGNDGVVDADLADVVKQSGIIYLPAFLFAFPHFFGNPPRVFRHPHGMSVGILVLCIDCRHKRLRGLLKQALRLLLLFCQLLKLFLPVHFNPLVPGPDHNNGDNRQERAENTRNDSHIPVENDIPRPDRDLCENCRQGNNKPGLPVKNHQADNTDIGEGGKYSGKGCHREPGLPDGDGPVGTRYAGNNHRGSDIKKQQHGKAGIAL